MINKEPVILVICLLSFIPELYAQAFNPINGTAYPIEFVEWIINGEDKLSALQSNVRSCTITFNSENTVVSFGNIMYKATYTFFPDGRCEVSIKAIFIQRTVLGIGRVERSGRDFTLFLSMRSEGEDIVTMIKGRIK